MRPNVLPMRSCPRRFALAMRARGTALRSDLCRWGHNRLALPLFNIQDAHVQDWEGSFESHSRFLSGFPRLERFLRLSVHLQEEAAFECCLRWPSTAGELVRQHIGFVQCVAAVLLAFERDTTVPRHSSFSCFGNESMPES